MKGKISKTEGQKPLDRGKTKEINRKETNNVRTKMNNATNLKRVKSKKDSTNLKGVVANKSDPVRLKINTTEKNYSSELGSAENFPTELKSVLTEESISTELESALTEESYSTEMSSTMTEQTYSTEIQSVNTAESYSSDFDSTESTEKEVLKQPSNQTYLHLRKYQGDSAPTKPRMPGLAKRTGRRPATVTQEYLSHYTYQGDWTPTKSRQPVMAEYNGPGPAAVRLPLTIGNICHDPRKVKAPAYTMASRGVVPEYAAEEVSPGPAVYDIRTLTNKGKHEFGAPLIGEKIKELEPFLSPGPLAYNRGDSDAIVYSKSPAFTIRRKICPTKSPEVPDPTRYNLPNTMGPCRPRYLGGGPAYSMSMKYDTTAMELKVISKSPGPLAYKLPSTYIQKTKPPAYSMGIRSFCSKFCADTPGPAANEVHKVKFHKPSTPRYSFGVRHSPYMVVQKFAPGD